MSTRDSRIAQKAGHSLDGFVISGYFFSILYAFLIITPLYFVVISAFKNNNQIITTPLALPSALDFNKFFQPQANVDLLRAMLISVVVAMMHPPVCRQGRPQVRS